MVVFWVGMEWKGTVWSVHVLVDLLVPVGSKRRFRRIVRSALVLSFLFSFRPTVLRFLRISFSFLSLFGSLVLCGFGISPFHLRDGAFHILPCTCICSFSFTFRGCFVHPTWFVRPSMAVEERTTAHRRRFPTPCVSLSLTHRVWGHGGMERVREDPRYEHRRISRKATTSMAIGWVWVSPSKHPIEDRMDEMCSGCASTGSFGKPRGKGSIPHRIATSGGFPRP